MKTKKTKKILKVSQKTKKRIPKKEDPIKALAETIVKAASSIKALDIVVIDLQTKASFADYLVICSGTSGRHIQAIADHVDEMVSKNIKRNPLGIEGQEGGIWVLVDYGDVVCHVFTEETREFYRIEDLWHDAKRVRLK